MMPSWIWKIFSWENYPEVLLEGGIDSFPLQNETVQNEIVPYSTLPKFNMEPENDDFQVCNLPFQCDTKMEDKI